MRRGFSILVALREVVLKIDLYTTSMKYSRKNRSLSTTRCTRVKSLAPRTRSLRGPGRPEVFVFCLAHRETRNCFRQAWVQICLLVIMHYSPAARKDFSYVGCTYFNRFDKSSSKASHGKGQEFFLQLLMCGRLVDSRTLGIRVSGHVIGSGLTPFLAALTPWGAPDVRRTCRDLQKYYSSIAYGVYSRKTLDLGYASLGTFLKHHSYLSTSRLVMLYKSTDFTIVGE